MTFWPKMLGAVVCWFLSMLSLMVVADHYITPIATDSLGLKLLMVLAIVVVILVVTLAICAFWLWVWARKYW